MLNATTATQGFFQREARPYRPKRPPSICIVGMTEAGFRQLALFARRGHRVVAVDPREQVQAEVNLGRSGLGDNEIDRALTDAVVGGRATAVGSALGAIVDTDATFFMLEGADARCWRQAARDAGIGLRARRGYHLVVFHAQACAVPARRLIAEIERLAGKRVGRDFGVCLLSREGDDAPDRLAVSDDEAGHRFIELHEGLELTFRRVPLGLAEGGLSLPTH
jgi:hypothetical protein